METTTTLLVISSLFNILLAFVLVLEKQKSKSLEEFHLVADNLINAQRDRLDRQSETLKLDKEYIDVLKDRAKNFEAAIEIHNRINKLHKEKIATLQRNYNRLLDAILYQ